jgi:acetyltransferase-like isoleucine patch superfamily enzyme
MTVSTIPPATRPPATGGERLPHGTAQPTGELRTLLVRVLNYVTNHIVAHVPSFSVRHFWYRHMIGIRNAAHGGLDRGCYIWFYGRRETRRRGVTIGRSLINRDCTLDIRGGLTVGDNVTVSPGVIVLTVGHDLNDPRFPAVDEPVRVEDDVSIGTRAMILPGVTLGRGCVVAAGAVVAGDVPPMTIVAGVPAKPIWVPDEEANTARCDGLLPLCEIGANAPMDE